MILPHLRICAFPELLIQAQISPSSRIRTNLPDASTPTNSTSQTLGMFSIFISLVIPLLSVFTVSSSALPSSRNTISSSLSSPFVFETLHTNNTSWQDLASPVSSYSPDCSISYGRYLNQASCNSALAKISQVTTPITFGERGTGTWDVVLPRRYLSGKFPIARHV